MATGRVSMAGGTFGTIRIVWDDDPSYEVAIAHCVNILVSVGQHVERGQRIASIGGAGGVPCHGHLGCKKNGVEVDIWPLLDQNQVGDMLQGINPRPVDNDKVFTSTGSTDGLRFRSSPFVKADNILDSLPNKTELHPDFIVDGTKVGSTADPKWYGAWAKTSKGIEFGYVSVLFCTDPVPIESTGFTQEQVNAKVAAAVLPFTTRIGTIKGKTTTVRAKASEIVAIADDIAND